MLKQVAPILSGIGTIVGVGLLYVAYFLTEPEEVKAQERLEQWWIVLDDFGGRSSQKLANLVQAAGARAIAAVDAVFGRTLVSFRGIWAASFFSAAFLLFTVAASNVFSARLATAAVGVVSLMFGFIPARSPSGRPPMRVERTRLKPCAPSFIASQGRQTLGGY